MMKIDQCMHTCREYAPIVIPTVLAVALVILGLLACYGELFPGVNTTFDGSDEAFLAGGLILGSLPFFVTSLCLGYLKKPRK